MGRGAQAKETGSFTNGTKNHDAIQGTYTIGRTKENKVVTLHETNEATPTLISNRTEMHAPV